MCCCVCVLNSPLSVSPIRAYYLECDLSLRFSIFRFIVQQNPSKLALGVILTRAVDKWGVVSVFHGDQTKHSQPMFYFSWENRNLLNLKIFAHCRICWSCKQKNALFNFFKTDKGIKKKKLENPLTIIAQLVACTKASWDHLRSRSTFPLHLPS